MKFGGILFNDFFSDDLATLFFKKKNGKVNSKIKKFLENLVQFLENLGFINIASK